MRAWLRRVLMLFVVWWCVGGVAHAALVQWRFEGTAGSGAVLGETSVPVGAPVVLDIWFDPDAFEYSDQFGDGWVTYLPHCRLQIGSWVFEAGRGDICGGFELNAVYPGYLIRTFGWDTIKGPVDGWPYMMVVVFLPEMSPPVAPPVGWLGLSVFPSFFDSNGEWGVGVTARQVPEPAILATLGLGLVAWRLRARRQR
jgi:hypothetical protein